MSGFQQIYDQNLGSSLPSCCACLYNIFSMLCFASHCLRLCQALAIPVCSPCLVSWPSGEFALCGVCVSHSVWWGCTVWCVVWFKWGCTVCLLEMPDWFALLCTIFTNAEECGVNGFIYWSVDFNANCRDLDNTAVVFPRVGHLFYRHWSKVSFLLRLSEEWGWTILRHTW